MRALSLCSGLSGLDLGLHRAGVETVAFVESDPFCCRILARHWPGVPTWDDVIGLDCDALPPFDLLTAGFPCQPHSTAGKREGVADSRWLWPAVLRVIRETSPTIVLLENVPGLLSSSNGDALFEILTGLESAGMTVEWDVLAAGTLGAPHRRERVFLVARRDGRWTWLAVGAQSSMFPGRRAAWPWSGRWERHTLTTCERRWPTPSTLPWEVAADAEALPTPRVSAERSSRGSMVHNRQWSAVALEQAVELKSGVLPREFHDESELTPGAARMLAEGRLRSSLPTPLSSDGYKEATNSLPRLIHTGHPRGRLDGLTREGEQILRHALPTPAARDHRDPNSADSQERRNDGSARGQQLPNELRDRGLYPEGASARLSPSLPEWMLGLPDGWSYPDGPSLLDVPSRPYLPDLTAELALTTEREHRRPRLRALGNACQVEVAEVIARAVLASARQDREQDRQDGAPARRSADDESPPVSGPRLL